MIFNFGKNKNDNKKSGKKKTAAKTDREKLIEEAMANAKKAREEIGEENLQKMAEHLKHIEKEDTQPAEMNESVAKPSVYVDMEDGTFQTREGRNAKQRVEDMDKRILASHLKDLIDEDNL